MSDEKPSPETKQDEAGTRTGSGDRRNKQLMRAGVAVGIGSAAIVAALLYTKGSRRAGE
jgi:hypothetical protein